MTNRPSSNDDNLDAVICVLVTVPKRSAGVQLAEVLVEKRLIACANILPEVTSIYRWEGKVESSSEAMLVLKSTQRQFENLRDTIVELHPYDLPEILALPVDQGLPGYLQWVRDEVGEG